MSFYLCAPFDPEAAPHWLGSPPPPPILGVPLVSFWFLSQADWRLNVVQWADPSHGCNRDEDQALKSAGLFQLWLLLLVSWNMVYGPDDDNLRLHQLREAMESCFKKHTPRSCPLFLELAPEMLKNLEEHGVQFSGEEDAETELWKWLEKRQKFVKAGRKTNLNRFQGSVTTAQRSLPYWWVDAFERVYTCLELDMMKGRQFMQRLVLRSGPAEEVGETGSTNPKKLTIESRSLKSCCQNSLVVSALVLSDPSNKRLTEMVVASTTPVMTWHTHQNRTLRSVDGSESWLKSQIAGELAKHFSDIVAQLCDPVMLDQCGFKAPVDLSNERAHNFADTEDDFAHYMGMYTMALAANRMKRTLWIGFGWPTRMVLALQGEPHATQVIAEFQKDMQVWEALSAMPRHGKILGLMYKRHPFQMTSVRQLAVALKDLGFQCHPDFLALLRKRARGVIATQGCEDAIGTAKNSKQSKASTKYRRPEKAMGVVLAKEVLHQRHGYDVVATNSPLESRHSRLPPSSFRASKATRSMAFSEIVSTNSTPEWWSPAAQHNTTPHADSVVLRAAFEAGDLTKVEGCWMGKLFCLEHLVAIKLSYGGAPAWFLPLRHFPQSGVLAWPLVMVTGGAGGQSAFEVSCEVQKRPLILPIWSLESIDAVSVSWASPASHRRVGGSFLSMRKSLRLLVHGKIAQVKEVAAREAFWELSRTELMSFAEEWDISIDSGESLMGVLFTMVKAITEVPDMDVMDIIHKRLARASQPSDWTSEILEIDEALQCVDRQDQELIVQEKKTAVQRAQETVGILQDYKQRRQDIFAKMTQREKRKRGPHVTPRSMPFTLTQAEAKQYLPPDASVWRGLTRQSWHGHCAGYRRCQAKWLDHGGEQEALRALMRTLWTQHLDKTGQQYSACPIRDLLAA